MQFLSTGERTELLVILRQRKVEGLKVRRVNALLLLDDGYSASFVARVLFLDADTVRRWRLDFKERGIPSVELSVYPAREGHLTTAQKEKATARFQTHPPRDTYQVRAWLQETFGIEYSRPGAIKLMHRIGFMWVRSEWLPNKADRMAEGEHPLSPGPGSDVTGLRKTSSI